MDFFGMGMGEIILVLIVATMIWGPGKIPEIARTLGKIVHTLRQTGSDLTAQITREIEQAEEEKKTHSPPAVVNLDPKTITLFAQDTPKTENAGKTNQDNQDTPAKT
jgi:sec-independent protein translocase protein TatA